MPGGDRTGPAGMGPMTGRATGICAGFGMPGYMNTTARRGMGFGFGRGGGRGYRNKFYATGLPGWQRAGMGHPVFGSGYGTNNPPVMTQQQELDILKEQSMSLEDSLSNVKKRIEELETEKNNH